MENIQLKQDSRNIQTKICTYDYQGTPIKVEAVYGDKSFIQCMKEITRAKIQQLEEGLDEI